jgi:hypothetical protein
MKSTICVILRHIENTFCCRHSRHCYYGWQFITLAAKVYVLQWQLVVHAANSYNFNAHCHLNAFNTKCCFKYQLLQKTSCFHCCTDLCRFPWQQKSTSAPDVAGLRLLGWFFLTIYQNHQQTVAATHEMNISMTKKISAGKCWASISLSHLIG